MPELPFEHSVFNPGRVSGRLIACVALSVMLHASLLLLVKRAPMAVDFQLPKDLFTFDASLRHEVREPEQPASPVTAANAAARHVMENAHTRRAAESQPVPTPDAAAQVPRPPSADFRAQPGTDQQGPHIDLDEARRIAREYSRRTVDPRFDAAAGAANTLEADRPGVQTIAKAVRPDCRTEYAGMGILAIPFLIRDTVANTGCKW